MDVALAVVGSPSTAGDFPNAKEIGVVAMPDSDTRELFKRMGEVERKLDLLMDRVPEKLPVRLDRLERSEETRRWSLRVVWAAIVGTLATLAHTIFGPRQQ